MVIFAGFKMFIGAVLVIMATAKFLSQDARRYAALRPSNTPPHAKPSPATPHIADKRNESVLHREDPLVPV